MSELTAREKGDIYREKRNYYLSSAEMRGKGTSNIFHLDTADFVLRELSNVKVKPFRSITGDEFADRPPTSSGQRAFSISIAEMKKTKDEPEISGLPDNVREVLSSTVSSFFTACGMDEEGNKITDRKTVKAGKESFLKNREAFSDLIKTENRKRNLKIISDFMAEKDLEEEMPAEAEKAEADFSTLIEKYPEAAKECWEEIGYYRKAVLMVSREAAEKKAGLDALFSEAMKVYFDESLDFEYRKDLRAAYLYYSREIDEKIRELLYTKEAVKYQVKWLLAGERTDPVIFEKIKENFGETPGVLNYGMLLCDVPEYVHPAEDLKYPVLTVDDLDLLFKRADEIRQYGKKHPEQFEAQCLLSAISLPKEYYDCIAMASSISISADSISSSEMFKTLDKESKIQLFFAWTLSDAVCRTGNVMTDFLLEFEDKKVGEASAVFKRILPKLCYSRELKKSKESLGVIMMERSGFHVPEEKSRFLEYFGL